MNELLDLIIKNEREARDVIRLVASENLPRLEDRLPFMLDMYARYSFDDDSVWKYPTYYLSDMERITENYLKEYLDCKYVSVKPISGLNGMLSVVSAFCSYGDTVMSLSPNDGGHFKTRPLVTKLGFNSIFLPYNREEWEIDVEKFKEYISDNKVKVVYIDLCMIAFPINLKKLKEMMDKDTLLIYDASHVLGLIVLGINFKCHLKKVQILSLLAHIRLFLAHRKLYLLPIVEF
jgi:glycine/serine hydroxymethyltransferase